MIIFDIKRYSINDGPGIRTTIFFKGCPLRCVWCHNPESWSAKPQKLYKKSKCIGCKSCIEACPQGAIEMTPDGIMPVRGVTCLQCGRCTEACPTTALEMCGREWTLDELMVEIEKERDIMLDSGGGVTLCGGEPLYADNAQDAHSESLTRLLDELGRRGFHRTVDTTLYADSRLVEEVAHNCELLLVDLKHMNSAIHRKYTGVGNEQILENIRLISTLDTPFWIRIPLIEGVNTDDANMEATVRFLTALWQNRQNSHPSSAESWGDTFQVNLLPYHDVGRDKHRRLWSDYNPQQLPLAAPSDETLQRCSAHFTAHGIKTIIGG